jgi:predicted  nucleic acid-binding Zn-ribbon protein
MNATGSPASGGPPPPPEIASLADLLDLQDVDLHIDRLLHRRETLPELAALGATRTAEADLGKKLAELETDLRSVRLDRDKAEGELAILEEKLGYEQKRLYAGGMSARETENMRREVEALKIQKDRYEENVLGLLDREESVEGPTVSLRESARQTSERAIELAATVQGRWREIDAEIARFESRKAEVIPLIDTELLELYEKLRKTKEGVAVGRLTGNVCGGCHLGLSATERLEILESFPPRCIHCRRILVS